MCAFIYFTSLYFVYCGKLKILILRIKLPSKRYQNLPSLKSKITLPPVDGDDILITSTKGPNFGYHF